MINHYIDLHEYINENIYRLPVKENQIITEAIDWGGAIKNTLIGGGIIGLIFLVLKFIFGKNNVSSSGGSGGGASDSVVESIETISINEFTFSKYSDQLPHKLDNDNELFKKYEEIPSNIIESLEKKIENFNQKIYKTFHENSYTLFK